MSKNNRGRLLDELDAATTMERTISRASDNNAELDEKIHILTKAMERLVKDVQQLKQNNAQLKAEIDELKEAHTAIGDQMGNMEFSTGADQDVREWMKEEANEDAFEIGISKSEMVKKMNDMAERRARFNMH